MHQGARYSRPREASATPVAWIPVDSGKKGHGSSRGCSSGQGPHKRDAVLRLLEQVLLPHPTLPALVMAGEQADMYVGLCASAPRYTLKDGFLFGGLRTERCCFACSCHITAGFVHRCMQGVGSDSGTPLTSFSMYIRNIHLCFANIACCDWQDGLQVRGAHRHPCYTRSFSTAARVGHHRASNIVAFSHDAIHLHVCDHGVC